MKRHPFLPVFVLFWTLAALPAYPADLFSPVPDPYGGLGLGSDPVPAMEDLLTGTLPGGLRYFILENSLPAERAYLTLAVRIGSVLENEDERGLAHFIEHMAFNGTENFPEAELVNYLRSLGMRFGPEVNAYTSYDQTVFGIETPTESGEDGVKRIPEKALAILDDWTHAITFAPKDVDDERAVILEELRSRLGATERVGEKMMQVILRGSRYVHRLPIGLPEVIRNAPAERLENFYKTWYRPENMALIFAGDFDGKALERELVSHFRISGSASPQNRPYYELPGPAPGSAVMEVISDPELPYSTVYLYYKRNYMENKSDLRQFRESVVDYLVSSMIDVRNEDAALKEETPFLGAGAWLSRYGRMSRFYVMAAQAKADRTEETLRALLLEKESLERFGFSREELDRAKASLVSYLEFQASEKDRRESRYFINSFVSDFLHDEKTPDIEWELEAVKRILPGISFETVNAAAASYFADDDLTVVIAAPEKEAVPDRDALGRMIQESREAAVLPAAAVSRGDLVSQTPRPGLVVNEEQDPSGALLWTLSNGAKLILKETTNRNNALSLYALAKGGESSAALEDDISAYMAREMQNASGLGPLDRRELSLFLSDKQLSLSFWTDTYTRGISGETSLGDIESFFQLLYVNFTQPRIDESGFKLVREARRTSLLQEEDDPETIFSREVTKFVYGGHPRFKPLELSDLDRLSAEKALSFLKKTSNPSDYTFVFTGSLGPADGGRFPLIRALAETWIASIPGTGSAAYPEAWNNWDDPGVKRPGKAEITLRKGKEQKALVYMTWFAKTPWTERANAAALALNEYLDIVLNDEIRETLGGVYSISERLALAAAPEGELSLGVFFVCDPARAGELRTAVKARLALIAEGRVDEEIFVRAKEALVKSFGQSMENNGFIARNYASFSLMLDIPLVHLDRRPELYRSVTAGEIRQILEQVLAGGPGEVVLFPE
ncbi:MAG: insulinase family protein [Treponema sp.]|jgi:zinc protease|nr:insulinase family protein [Treponema sp.]